MTKNEYLIELAIKIQSLAGDPAAVHDELKAMISFYQEMIDDKIEDGMTEEEAVAEMETPEDIARRLKSELEAERTPAAVEEETDAADKPGKTVYARACGESTLMRREYDPDTLERIIIEDENCPIQIKTGDTVAVSCYDNAEGFYEVVCSKGALTVKYKRNIRSFFRLPIFGMKRGTLVLEVPRGWDGELSATTCNAKIELEAEIRDIMLRTRNAKIEIKSVVADRLRTVTNNGMVYADHAICREAEFITSNAKVDANNVTAREELILTTSNGSVVAENISAPRFVATTSNGGINVRLTEADDITLRSANGAIKGTLPGSMADYAITSKTSNGKNSLPDGTSGTKKLDVRTSNAGIGIEFTE